MIKTQKKIVEERKVQDRSAAEENEIKKIQIKSK